MPINSFLYPGAKVVPPFTVANSLRFDGSSSNLSRTKGTSDSTKIGTYSWWIKNSKFTGQNLIDCGDAFANSSSVYISSSNTLTVFSRISNSNVLVLETDREFRDPSAWHNIVVAIDTTQSTASNRAKVYVDGVQQTSFSTETYPDQNADLRFFTSSETEKISSTTYESGGYFGGYMCEVVKVDGQALAPTSFGEFDEDSPTIWKPIDVAGLTFGTNGYYLDFEDSSNLGNNVSGGSDFTANNLASTDQSTDTCSNNYPTFNPLLHTNATLSEGNLQAQSPASGGNGGISTFGASKGKWYAEFKQVAESTSNEGAIGVIDTVYLHTSNVVLSSYIEYNAGTYGLRDNPSNNAAFYTSGGSVTSTSNFHGSWATNDIIGIALDIDNNKVYFSKNGQWVDGSGNWDESNPSGYLTIQSDHGEGTYMFAVGDSSSANNVTWQANFGSPPFSISSGNSDANGYGNFEYAVPSGYYALNTKNLAEFG